MSRSAQHFRRIAAAERPPARPGIRKVGLDRLSRKCPDLGCEFRDSLLLAGAWLLRTGGHAAGGVTLSHQMLAPAYAPVRPRRVLLLARSANWP